MMLRFDLIPSAAALCAALVVAMPHTANAQDHITKWVGTSVLIRRAPDASAAQIRVRPDDLPQHPDILEEINGFCRFHDPALNADMFVLRRDVETEAGNAQASKQAVVDPCVQRGTMGMNSCN